MATPALDRAVRIRPGGSRDLDEVMEVMGAAFGGFAFSVRNALPTFFHWKNGSFGEVGTSFCAGA